MPAQTRDVRLRIPDFTVPKDAPSGDNDKDLIFILRADSIKREVSDGVIIGANGNFEGGYITPTLIIKETITVDGVVYDPGHVDHPVLTSTPTENEHDPDMIDLEEAAVSWNQTAGLKDGQYVHLETDFDGNVWRTYQGIILRVTLLREAAHTEIPFSLVFGVLFEPRTLPGLREWA